MTQRKEKELLKRMERIEKRAERLHTGLKLLVSPAIDNAGICDDNPELAAVLRLNAIALALRNDTKRLEAAVLQALNSGKGEEV